MARFLDPPKPKAQIPAEKVDKEYKAMRIKVFLGAFLGYGDFSIEVDSNNRYYDSRNHCNAIIETRSNTLVIGCSSTIIPAGITKIDSYAFCDCFNLCFFFP